MITGKIANIASLLGMVIVCGFAVGCSTVSPTSQNRLQLPASANQEGASGQNGLSAEARAQAKIKSASEELVAPGFEIELANPEDEKLNGKFRVDFEGILKLPYNISVNVHGLNERGLANRITAEYSKFYQTTPNLEMKITEKVYWVDVRGLVVKPGQYLVRKGASLDEVLGLAGGVWRPENPEKTGPKYVRVVQDRSSSVYNLGEYYSGATIEPPVWEGGDVVFAQTERGPDPLDDESVKYVRVLGQVRNPGEYSFRSGDDFFAYLIKAGGPTERADLSRIDLIRRSGSGTETVSFDSEDKDEIPQLLGGDTILIHSDTATGFERRTRVVGSVASIISTIATVVILAIAI